VSAFADFPQSKFVSARARSPGRRGDRSPIHQEFSVEAATCRAVARVKAGCRLHSQSRRRHACHYSPPVFVFIRVHSWLVPHKRESAGRIFTSRRSFSNSLSF